ncbi:MAG: hypothetical protein ACREOE_08615, partial [Gemmatimonadales bacterium]
MTLRLSGSVVAALMVAGCAAAPGATGFASPAESPVASPSTPPASAMSRLGGAPSPGPTPLPAGPDVPLAGLSDANHGWAVTGEQLLVTADGGSTWRDATPPGGFATPDTGGLLGVAFADAQH